MSEPGELVEPVRGYIDTTAAQWHRIVQLASAHGQADKYRRSSVSLEQDQRYARGVRLTLCHEQAEHPHAAFLIEASGAYRTAEP